MDWRTDQERIAPYFDRLADRHGPTPGAVDAGSQASLDVRYRALSELTDMNGKTVLEVGCGFGGLGAYLVNRFPDIDYTGIDISERAVATGRTTYPDLKLTRRNLMELPAEPGYDVVLAQGIFYLLGVDAGEKAQELLKRMFHVARESVGCCAISTWADHQTPGEYYLDPALLLAWGGRLTKRLVLRHDHHPGDVCVYLFKS